MEISTTIDTLEAKGYTIVAKLHHDQVVPFVQQSMNLPTFYSYFYKGVVFFTFGWLCALLTYNCFTQGWSAFTDFSKLLLSLALVFAIIPIHEWIHMAAYKLSGAPTTIFRSNWKKFYFVALADLFVTDVKTFKFVALAPFCILSGLALLSFIWLDPSWHYVPLGFLFFHSFACAGDFGLLSYVTSFKDTEIVTFDDVQNNVSYFYSRPK